jgi:three-Cys-motif partner protein
MAGSSKYRASRSDGLPCRVSGVWAQEKLYYVGRYMAIVNGGMKNRWPQRAFVELMAGPGRCILENSDEEFDGSPLLALKCEPGFTSVVLVESDERLLDALRARTAEFGTRAEVLPGDCNDVAVVERIRDTISPNALTLAFVDMLGLDVTFATLKRLTTGRKIDLVITFQVNDLVRNVPSILEGRVDGERLDQFFGTSAWRHVVAAAEGGKLTTSEIGDALTEYYVRRLGTLNYQHVAPLHVLMKNTRNAPLYRLILAARHERATDFFAKISKIEYSGQRGLALS